MSKFLRYLHDRWLFGITALIPILLIMFVVWFTDLPAVVAWILVLIQWVLVGLQTTIAVKHARGTL